MNIQTKKKSKQKQTNKIICLSKSLCLHTISKNVIRIFHNPCFVPKILFNIYSFMMFWQNFYLNSYMYSMQTIWIHFFCIHILCNRSFMIEMKPFFTYIHIVSWVLNYWLYQYTKGMYVVLCITSIFFVIKLYPKNCIM